MIVRSTQRQSQNLEARQHRVTNIGEIFTPPEVVNAMLDLLDHEHFASSSRFLEPSCGTGNFLVEIARRKTAALLETTAKLDENAVAFILYLVATSLYGIDLMHDNVEQCRRRLSLTLLESYEGYSGLIADSRWKLAIDHVLEHNVLCGDTLTMHTESDQPLLISFWQPDLSTYAMTRHVFSYSSLVAVGGEFCLTDSPTSRSSLCVYPLVSSPTTHYLNQHNWTFDAVFSGGYWQSPL